MYPNQRTVTILKRECKSDFLQINNDEWQQACQCIEHYGTFKLYLYLASNKDGFNMYLSPVAIENAIGISESTYRRALKELQDLGYLLKVEGRTNLYVFHPNI